MHIKISAYRKNPEFRFTNQSHYANYNMLGKIYQTSSVGQASGFISFPLVTTNQAELMLSGDDDSYDKHMDNVITEVIQRYHQLDLTKWSINHPIIILKDFCIKIWPGIKQNYNRLRSTDISPGLWPAVCLFLLQTSRQIQTFTMLDGCLLCFHLAVLYYNEF